MYSAVVCGGRTFLQLFDEVLELVGNKLVRICKIPALNLSEFWNFYLKLFVVNDSLYFSNGSLVYKLENNEAVYQMDFSCDCFVSFCGTTLCWYPGVKITLLNPDFSEFPIC